MSDKQYIWNYFKNKLNNEYGVAGLMGNLQAESGLISYRVQGDFTDGYTYSKTYTANVDNGIITEYDFVNNGPNGGGYGLAQWTFYTRKQLLYTWYKNYGYDSIGSIELACDFLYYELQTSFPSVLSTLKNASSIRVASDCVLHDFERPADQSEAVEELRESLSQTIYNELTGSSGSEGSEGSGSDSEGVPKTLKHYKFYLFNRRIYEQN